MAAAGDDAQLGVGEAARHQPGVGHRDERVVVAGQDQGAVGDLAEPAQAGPAGQGQELTEIPPHAGRPCRAGRDVVVEGDGTAPRLTAEQDRGDRPVVRGRVEAERGSHEAEGEEIPRHSTPAAAGGGQDEGVDVLRMAVGHRLGHASAEGHAEDVDPGVAQGVDDRDGQSGVTGHGQRRRRGGRQAGSGGVERDHLTSRQCVGQRPPTLDAAAEPVDEQQGTSPTLDCDTYGVPGGLEDQSARSRSQPAIRRGRSACTFPLT